MRERPEVTTTHRNERERKEPVREEIRIKLDEYLKNGGEIEAHPIYIRDSKGKVPSAFSANNPHNNLISQKNREERKQKVWKMYNERMERYEGDRRTFRARAIKDIANLMNLCRSTVNEYIREKEIL